MIRFVGERRHYDGTIDKGKNVAFNMEMSAGERRLEIKYSDLKCNDHLDLYSTIRIEIYKGVTIKTYVVTFCCKKFKLKLDAIIRGTYNSLDPDIKRGSVAPYPKCFWHSLFKLVKTKNHFVQVACGLSHLLHATKY